MTAARARAYDALQAEFAADERREIEARGGVAPFADGTPKTVIRGTDAGYVAMCSCGFMGVAYTDYVAARTVARKHRCSP